MTEIKITRRATVDKDFNYYEFHVTYDPAVDKGNDIIKEIEKTVAFARKKLTPKAESKQPEKAPKIPTKKSKVFFKEMDKDFVDSKQISTEDIKISELQEGDKVNISVRLLKVGAPKSFISKTDGSPGVFCKCDVEDGSGQMKLTLFGDQVALVRNVKRNAWLKIENGYVKSYQGTLELSVGQYGKMEVVYNG